MEGQKESMQNLSREKKKIKRKEKMRKKDNAFHQALRIVFFHQGILIQH